MHIAARGLEEGALGNDAEVLTDLGAFNKSVGGAGTVAAISSIFLASKHAAAPFEGVARAALAKGADTDTIASLTGTLAGAVSGTDWLGARPHKLQDVSYIERTALALADNEQFSANERVRPFTAKDSQSLFDALEGEIDRLTLPIGLTAKVEVSDHVATSAPSLRARSWRIETREGQTFYVKKLRKVAEPVALVHHKIPARIVATRLWVADLTAARQVYEMDLGLKVTSQSDTHLQFGDAFALRLGEPSISSNPPITLYISVPDVEAVHDQIKELELAHVGMITHKSGRAAFGCIDRDGYRLEVFEE